MKAPLVSSVGVASFLLWLCTTITRPVPTASVNYEVPVTILLNFDKYPLETGWSLVCGETVYANYEPKHYGPQYSEDVITETFQVPDQSPCTFTIDDSYGDGICCSESYGSGFFRIYLDDSADNDERLAATGGDFGNQDVVSFIAEATSHTFSLRLYLDSQPQETGWSLVCDGQEVDSVSAPNYAGMTGVRDERTFDLDVGADCELMVVDTGNNGLCCGAKYQLFYGIPDEDGNVLLKEGADFDSSETFSFTALAQESDCPANDPDNYNICIDTETDGGYTSELRQVVREARAKWESVIASDTNQPSILGSTLVNLGIPICNEVPHFLDDMYICARHRLIDGDGGILGQGEITAITSPARGRFPVAGYIQFDSADLASLLSRGAARDIAMHEIGHLLGIGSLWSLKNLITYNSTAWVYTGEHACTEWESITNCVDSCPPVENSVNNGMSDGRHWDETALEHELMTSFAEAGGASNPLSRVTVGTLEDLGYTVDYSNADVYPGDIPIASCLETAGGDSNGDRYLKGSKTRRAAQTPTLSSEGLSIARKHGEKLLAEGTAKRPRTMGGADVEYAAGRHVNVVYEENNVLYFVDVQTIGG